MSELRNTLDLSCNFKKKNEIKKRLRTDLLCFAVTSRTFLSSGEPSLKNCHFFKQWTTSMDKKYDMSIFNKQNIGIIAKLLW